MKLRWPFPRNYREYMIMMFALSLGAAAVEADHRDWILFVPTAFLALFNLVGLILFGSEES